MEKSRYECGTEIIRELAGDHGIKAVDGVKAFSPDFAKILAEFAFGEIYSRPVFDFKQRELMTLSSLITQDAGEEALQFHFKAAFKIGMTLEELLEVVMHCAVYAGFPRALNALGVLKKVSEARNLKE